jgi:hypothetical protein
VIAVAESTEDRLRELYPGRMGTVLVRLQSHDKKPIDQGWNRQAAENWSNQIDPAPVLASLAEHIDAGGNVGWAIPPGILVLDADDATSAAWITQALPDAPRQRSRKGVHVVVRAPAGVDLRQVTAFEIVEGVRVDLRTPGRGQIAVEPSIHPTGFLYSWEVELPLDPDSIPELPEGIIARLRELSKPSNTVDINEASWREGSREARLVSMAGRLRKLGMHEEEIRGALGAVNAKRCAPLLSDKDVARIARSAGKWDRGQEPEEAKPAASADTLSGIFFTGQRVLDLLNEPEPEPVYPGIPPAGHFSLLIAPSFSGKTSLALWQAMACIRGASPWKGAPAYKPGKVLFYSIDEPPGQVAHRLRALAMKHPAGKFVTDYAHGITITGPHPTVDPEQLGQLRFTDEGLAVLDELLGKAAADGSPFAYVIVDAYSDLLPLGESDSSNEEATRIGGALERLAVTYGCAIQVIHHAGKPVAGQDLPDPRDYGRGASALAAKARCIFTLEEEAGMPNVRRVRTRTNLTASPGPFLLAVSDERSAGSTRIDYFRPHDSVGSFPIAQYLTTDDGWISVTQLARRLGGDGDDPQKQPPGSLLRQARDLRGIWDNAGLIEVRTGARNALELRRV